VVSAGQQGNHSGATSAEGGFISPIRRGQQRGHAGTRHTDRGCGQPGFVGAALHAGPDPSPARPVTVSKVLGKNNFGTASTIPAGSRWPVKGHP
jgi:hypothetical protein